MINDSAAVNGLKAICAIWITILHYLLAFAPVGYVGWGSGVAPETLHNYFFTCLPYSLFTNSSFPLAVFFAIIAFIPALHFFHNHDEQWIRRQAVIRYFRFLPPVFLGTFLMYFLCVSGLNYNQELGDLLNHAWPKALLSADFSFIDVLKSVSYRALWFGDGSYNSALWCMNIILIGSYLSYAFLFFFGYLKRRKPIYVALFSLGFFAPLYAPFLAGIVAADLVYHKKGSTNKTLNIMLLFIGIAFGMAPKIAPYEGLEYISYSIGSCLVLLSCARSQSIKEFLAQPFFVRWGQLSFPLILVHFFIMCSLSAWGFLLVYPHVGYTFALLITFVIAIPANAFAAIAFQAILKKVAGSFPNAIYKILTNTQSQ